MLPVFVARVRELPPAETVGLAVLRFQLRTRSSFRELNRQVFVTKRGARYLADHGLFGSDPLISGLPTNRSNYLLSTCRIRIRHEDSQPDTAQVF